MTPTTPRNSARAPSPSSPYAYDQVYVLKHAIERAGTADDTKKVTAEALRKLPVPKEAVMKYLPVDGTMFDVNGQAYTSNGAFQWQKGKWVFVADLPSDTKAYSEFLRSLASKRSDRRRTSPADRTTGTLMMIEILQQILNGLAIGAVYVADRARPDRGVRHPGHRPFRPWLGGDVRRLSHLLFRRASGLAFFPAMALAMVGRRGDRAADRAPRLPAGARCAAHQRLHHRARA